MCENIMYVASYFKMFSVIKDTLKLSEVNSQDSSGSVVNDRMLGVEVQTLVSFCTFLSHSDCSFILNVQFYTCFISNSIVFQTIKRHCYDDQPMYTLNFKLFQYVVYPVAMTIFLCKETFIKCFKTFKT